MCPTSQLIYVPINKNLDIKKNRLWLVINSGSEEMEKIENKDIQKKLENKNIPNESESKNEDYYLNENDVIKFGNIIYIVKEIHIRNRKENKSIQKNEKDKK